VEAWLARLVEEGVRRAALDVERIAAALEQVRAKDWIERARFEDGVPYGRTVLAASEGLEVMKRLPRNSAS
jgi:hypothetical protein